MRSYGESSTVTLSPGTTSIDLADYMYRETLQLEKRAKKWVITKNENLLRLALDKYNQIILFELLQEGFKKSDHYDGLIVSEIGPGKNINGFFIMI